MTKRIVLNEGDQYQIDGELRLSPCHREMVLKDVKARFCAAGRFVCGSWMGRKVVVPFASLA